MHSTMLMDMKFLCVIFTAVLITEMVALPKRRQSFRRIDPRDVIAGPRDLNTGPRDSHTGPHDSLSLNRLCGSRLESYINSVCFKYYPNLSLGAVIPKERNGSINPAYQQALDYCCSINCPFEIAFAYCY